MNYQFSNDWFRSGSSTWPEIASLMKQRSDFLEIGSYEGRSSVWTVENMITDSGSLTCIDNWKGGEEHSEHDMAAVEARFDYNINLVTTKFPLRDVYKMKQSSIDALATLVSGGAQFDFIYIDGSHQAKDVLTDSCLAWPLLRPGGFMVWDDYLWGHPRDVLHKPKFAIDAFMTIFGEHLKPVIMSYQMIVRKTGGSDA
jgi:predicted O-methyltransferase YrrM